MSEFVIEQASIPATIHAAERPPGWRDESEPKLLYAARVGDRVVARALLRLAPMEDGTAGLSVQVLPAYRRLGIGRALCDLLERMARERGRERVLVRTASREGAGARIPALTGSGSVPLGSAEVRFLLGRGYSLEQVYTMSRPTSGRPAREEPLTVLRSSWLKTVAPGITVKR